jgi:type IV secretion system protein VirB8
MSNDLPEQIENEQYFERARSWYVDKYVAINSQAVGAFLIMVILAAASYFTVDSMLLKYFKIMYPVPIYVDDQVNFQSKIAPLATNYESIDISIARSLLTNYIINREEYRYSLSDPEVIKERLAAIRSSSSRRVYDDYLAYLDPRENPDSPIIKYKTKAERNVKIVSVTFPKSAIRPKSAIVEFSTIEAKDENNTGFNWIAEVQFSLSSISDVLERKSGCSFIVTRYQVTSKNS